MTKTVRLNSDENYTFCDSCSNIIVYTNDSVIDDIEYAESLRHTFCCHNEYIICPECGKRIYIKDWAEEVK